MILVDFSWTFLWLYGTVLVEKQRVSNPFERVENEIIYGIEFIGERDKKETMAQRLIDSDVWTWVKEES